MIVQALSYNTQKLKVGLFYQGGIIVYVDNTARQGMIAYNGGYSSTDLAWGPTGAYTQNDGYGYGYTNTQNAYNTLSPASNTALNTVWNATFSGYSDWFLPSKTEAVYIFQSKQYFSFWTGSGDLPGLADTAAWAQNFDGTQNSQFRNATSNRRSIACRYISFT